MITELILSSIVALSTVGNDNKCTVKGHITGLKEDTKAYVLSILGGMKRDTIQTGEVKDGCFTLTIPNSCLGEVYEMAIGDNPAHFIVFAEEGTVIVNGDSKALFFTEVNGTRANDEYTRYRQNVAKSAQARDMEIGSPDLQNLTDEQSKARRGEIMKKYNAIMDNHITDVIGDGTSLAGVFVCWQRKTMYTVDEIDEILNRFKPSLASTKYYKGLQQRCQTLRNTSPGAMAPTFTAVTPEGKIISNSDMRGKYYILDFWASWCHPCRNEGKIIKEIYETLKGKNFDVLSISSDKNEQAWRKAIEEDGMTWKQGLLVGDNQKKVYSQYGIVGIPAIWVIDAEGRIIAKQLRGEKLKAFCLGLF